MLSCQVMKKRYRDLFVKGLVRRCWPSTIRNIAYFGFANCYLLPLLRIAKREYEKRGVVLANRQIRQFAFTKCLPVPIIGGASGCLVLHALVRPVRKSALAFSTTFGDRDINP